MLKRIIGLGIALILMLSQIAFAIGPTGKLFNITATGPADTVQITLCLNGQGPLSCQNYTVANLHLSISPVPLYHVYPGVGIRIDTPGYTYARLGLDCTLISNGFCIFSASSVAPGQVNLKATTAPPVNITATPSTDAFVGETYSQSNVASKGTQPYTYSVFSGTLPTGTSLNPSTGLVSGIPVAGGPFTYTIEVTDANFATATATTNVTIGGGVILTSTPSVATEVGVSYSQTNVGSGGAPPFTYSVSAGTLPAGTTLNTSSGTVAGTPTTAGAFSYSITVTDSNGGTATNLISGNINTAVSLTATPSTNTRVGINYSQTNMASGGTPPYAYNLFSGTLPTGTTLNTTTGTVSGSPTTVQSFSYTIQVTDNVGATATATSTGNISYNPWSVSTIDPPNHLSAVSCASNSFCMAVDQSGNALEYNGLNWASTTPPNSNYSSVSCPTSSFCAATGNAGGNGSVYTYNGSSWASYGSNPIDAGNNLVSVSCPTATFCMAVDGLGNSFIFNGTTFTWTAGAAVALSLTAVSCLSNTFCMAVDAGGNAASYNGTTWQTYNSVSTFELSSVSCAQNSGSFCMAVNTQGTAYKFTAGSWDGGTTIDGSNALTAVSCISAAFCTAVDSIGNAMNYNGVSWSAPSLVDSGNSINSVSCPLSSFCAAVDSVGNALLYVARAVNVVVANQGTGTYATPAAFTFPVTATGNVAPTYEVSGLSKPLGAYIDLNNNLWVADNGAAKVYRLSASASGAVSTHFSVSLANASSTTPTGVWTDLSGNIYVTDKVANAIFIYPATYQVPGTYATAAPSKTITAGSTTLNTPTALALDATNNIWVANQGANSILKFAAGTTGGTSGAAPATTIVGAATLLNAPNGIFIDTSGNIWVTNHSINSIYVFASGSSGNVAPSCVISSTAINAPVGIALDSQGNIYQANDVASGGAINIFATVSANCGTTTVSPTATISGASTLIDAAFALALGYVF